MIILTFQSFCDEIMSAMYLLHYYCDEISGFYTEAFYSIEVNLVFLILFLGVKALME